MLAKIARYFKGVILEMKRVRWLTVKETAKLSTITFCLVVLISSFTFVVGLLFSEFTKIVQSLV